MHDLDPIYTDYNYTRVFDSNQSILGIMLRPSGKTYEATIRLTIVGRPHSLHGTAQGDHTLAWAAIAKSLEWLFKDVTLKQAVANIIELHRGLHIAFRSSFTNGDTLMSSAEAVHRTITKERCPPEVLSSWITEYLLYYCHIRNAQPEASVISQESSGGKGEGTALKNLKDLEKNLKTRVLDSPSHVLKENAVQSLSTLIDKNAIQTFVQNSGQGNSSWSQQRMVMFLLFGIHTTLRSLPNISKLLLSGLKSKDLLSPENTVFPRELLADLATIIFYNNQQKPNESEQGQDKLVILKALTSIIKSIA